MKSVPPLVLSLLLFAASPVKAQNTNGPAGNPSGARTAAEDLMGKYLYSHHNASASTNPDSIYVLEEDSTTETFITLGIWPRLSHNSQYLAFSRGPNPNSVYGANLWVRDLQASTEEQIVPNSDYLNYYDFSPTNQKIIYSQGCSLFTTNPDGTNSYAGVRNGDCFDDNPTIRMSDSMVVFHNLHAGLITMNFDGSNAALVPNTIAGDLYASWSGDGQWLAFLRQGTLATAGYLNAIAKIKPDGSGLAPLVALTTSDTIAPYPVFTRDFATVSFIARIGGVIGLYEAKTDGSGNYNLVHPFSSQSVMDYFLGLSDTVTSFLSLPVSLVRFEGKWVQNKGVELNWETASEINTSGFTVERSEDGHNFSSVGSVPARNGNGGTYQYEDHIAAPGNTVYYRLKTVDKDGSFSYSKVVQVQARSGFSAKIYPNPSRGEIILDLNTRHSKVEVTLSDVSGRQVYYNVFYNISSQKITTAAGKGIYTLKIVTEKGSTNQKIIVQ